MKFYDYARVRENKEDVYNKDDKSERTISNCYKALCIEVIYRAYDDYLDYKVQGKTDKMESIERWIDHGNFGLFCWVDYDPQAVIASIREYQGRNKRLDDKKHWGLRNNVGGCKAHDRSGIAWDARGVYGRIL